MFHSFRLVNRRFITIPTAYKILLLTFGPESRALVPASIYFLFVGHDSHNLTQLSSQIAWNQDFLRVEFWFLLLVITF